MTIRQRFELVRREIEAAAIQSGRTPEDVRLVVVTKGQPLDSVREVVDAGAKWLGENYPEQAIQKILALKEFDDVEWHMIGHLQSRKVEIVCAYFSMMHSMDRLELARKMEKELAKSGKVLPILLEINIGQEATKSGWHVGTPEEIKKLFGDVQEIAQLGHLKIQGIMAMPPLVENPVSIEENFRHVGHIKQILNAEFPNLCWKELSMGTSSDYIPAIKAGATIVRIGNAIMGPRSYNK